jgi:hypothetical protein
VRQKSQARSQKGNCKPPKGRLIRIECDDPEKKRTDDGQSRGQAVEPVKKIHGIGQAHNPQNREGNIDQVSPARPVKESEFNISPKDNQKRNENLKNEFEKSRKRVYVIDKPNHKDQGGS